MGLPRSPKCSHTGDGVSFLVGNGSGWVTEAGSDAGGEGKGGTRLHSSRLQAAALDATSTSLRELLLPFPPPHVFNLMNNNSCS